MIYRFDAEGNGAVVAEARRDDLEPLLGNHYPASDIPNIARRLYLRNRVRVLADVMFAPVPIVPRPAPEGGVEPDVSLATLRSPSPIHVQYLKNMGVSATLVVSLMVDGRLWGLISCHHYAPREVHFEARAVCELLAEAVATRIAALESFFPRIRKAYLIGEAANEFAATLAGRVDHAIVGTLDKAVEAAARDAEASNLPAAAVLLSPACASFDQYRNFEVRGDAFRKLVLALPGLASR